MASCKTGNQAMQSRLGYTGEPVISAQAGTSEDDVSAQSMARSLAA